MADWAGQSNDGARRLDFDRCRMLRVRDTALTSNARLLAYREPERSMRTFSRERWSR